MLKVCVFLAILGIACSIGSFYPYPYPYPAYGGWGCRQPTYNANGTHSVFIGCVRSTDKLLFNQDGRVMVSPSRYGKQDSPDRRHEKFMSNNVCRVYNKTGSIFGTTQKIIRYPKSGYIRNETISGIWMFDYDRYGRGGYGRVTSGGVGYKNVTIDLRSYKWGRGFNYLIQIYGS